MSWLKVYNLVLKANESAGIVLVPLLPRPGKQQDFPHFHHAIVRPLHRGLQTLRQGASALHTRHHHRGRNQESDGLIEESRTLPHPQTQKYPQ